MAAPIIGMALTAAAVAAITKVVMRTIGVGVIVYVGGDYLLGELENLLLAETGGLGADAAAILGIARIDEAINIVLSALAIKLALRGTKRLGII